MKWLHEGWVESDSELGVWHEIKRHPITGALGCACKKYQFSKGTKTCHHLGAYVAAPASFRAEPAGPAVRTARVATVEGGTFTVRRGISFGAVPVAVEPEGLTLELSAAASERLRRLAKARGVAPAQYIHDVILASDTMATTRGGRR